MRTRTSPSLLVVAAVAVGLAVNLAVQVAYGDLPPLPLLAGLTPLVCVGEPLEVRRAGGASDFVAAQVRAALSQLEPADVAGVLVAYEPIWAIGEHGIPATQEQIAPVMALIASTVAEVADGGAPLASRHPTPASGANLSGAGKIAQMLPRTLSRGDISVQVGHALRR